MQGFASKSAALIIGCLWASMASAVGSMVAPAIPATAPLTLEGALKQALVHPHLRPDLRFTGALEIVDSFPEAPEGRAPTLGLAGGGWSVSDGGRVIGTLPQYPDFTDAMSLLRLAAKSRVAALHASSGDVPPAAVASEAGVLDEHSLIQALGTLDEGYSQKGLSATSLSLAAGSVSRLALMEDDAMGTADAVYAKAMALVALAEAVSGKPMPKEESMLAFAMGYERAAWEASQQLPAGDIWRLYMARDDVGLEQAAKLHPDDPDSNYLWLRRLADLNRVNDWVTLMKARYGSSTPPVAVFDTELRMANLGTWQDGATVVPVLVLIALPGTEHLSIQAVDTRKEPAKVLAYFDQGVPYVKAMMKGPYLSGDEAVAYYRGFMDTGVSALGRYYLDGLKDHGAAKGYHDLLSTAFGENGQALYGWFDARWRASQSGLSVREVMSAMASAKMLSPYAYSGLWSSASASLGGSNPQVRDAAWRLTSLYDTRTDMRLAFAETLHWINDIPDFEQAFTSLADQESDRSPYVKLRLAGYEDDLPQLFRVAQDKSLDKRKRVIALTDIRDPREAPDEVRAAYRSILADYPDYSFAYISYVRFLDSVKDYAEIEHIAPTWLTADTSAGNGFDYQDACVAAADAELKLGHVSGAWATISRVLFTQPKDPAAKPEIATYYGKVLAEGVRVALAKGDLALAETIARTEAARFPDNFERQWTLLEVYWKQKRYADAANYLAAWPHPIPYWEWPHNFAYEFAQVFGTDTGAGVEAYKALWAVAIPGSPTVLTYLADGVGYTDPDLSYAMRHEVMRPEMEGSETLPQILEDYKDLKATKGIDAARAWAQPKLAVYQHGNQAPGALTATVETVYQSGVYDLLWDAVPDPDTSSNPSMVWLLFAAAHAQQPTESPQQLAALRQHFAKAGDSWHDQLGKYLMGDVKAEAILKQSVDSLALSEASYYFALRAASDHEYADAEDWLQMDIITQRRDNNEYGWGEALLNHWNQAYEALAVLDKQGRLYQDKH